MCVDLQVAFTSMFLLAFGLSAFGLGLFTTYFGAGKSRMIGVILTLIGLVVLLIFYFMTIDYFGYGWQSEDVKDSFLAVLGITIGGIVSFALVIILMMIIKEPEPEIPGIEDWEKELAAMDTEKPDEDKEPKEGAEEKEPAEEVPEPGDGDDKVPEDEREPEDEGKDDLPESEGPEEEEATDDMSAFLKDKEEKKIVKEEWEKVDEDGNVEEPEEPDIPSEGPEEEPEAPGEEEPEAPGDEEPEAPGDEEPEVTPEETEPEPLPPMDDDELPENPEEPEDEMSGSEPESGDDAMNDGEEKKEGD